MEDEKLNHIDAQMERLRQQRGERVAQLKNPQWQKIREAYVRVQRALSELEELGEDPEDSEGRGIYISGHTFSVTSEGIYEK